MDLLYSEVSYTKIIKWLMYFKFVCTSLSLSVRKKTIIANLGMFELSHRYKSLHDVFLQLSTISPCSWFVGFLDYILFYDIIVIPRIIRQNESKCIMLNIKCVVTLHLVMLNFAFYFSYNIFGKKIYKSAENGTGLFYGNSKLINFHKINLNVCPYTRLFFRSYEK